MNLRRESLAELIINNLDVLNIKDDDLVIVRLPIGLTSKESEAAGQAIVNVLRANGKSNAVLALPVDMKIENLNADDMLRLGWIKNESTNSNVALSGLQEYTESPKVTLDITKADKPRSSEAIDEPYSKARRTLTSYRNTNYTAD